MRGAGVANSRSAAAYDHLVGLEIKREALAIGDTERYPPAKGRPRAPFETDCWPKIGDAEPIACDLGRSRLIYSGRRRDFGMN